MADNTSSSNTNAGFGWNDAAQLLPGFLQSVNQNTAANRQANQAENFRKQGTLQFGGLPGEQQAHVAMQRENSIFGAPQAEKQFERVNTPTMTGPQQWASNLSLFASAPGQLQKAIPGLLPAIKKHGGAAGGFISDLFGPDTSHIDAAAEQERRNFEERVIPEINARFGAGQDVLRDRAIADARTDLQERLVGMKAKAYEQGLERNAKNSGELFEAGMKPQFAREWQEKAGTGEKGETPEDRANKALMIKDPITGKEESPSEFIERNKKKFEYKGKNYSKQFDAIYKNADLETKFAMRNMLEKSKGKLQPYTRKLRTAEDFQKYAALDNSPNKYIKEIMSKNGHKRDMENLFHAVKERDVSEFERLAKKYRVKLPSGGRKVIADLLVHGLAAAGGVAAGVVSANPAVGLGTYAAGAAVGQNVLSNFQ